MYLCMFVCIYPTVYLQASLVAPSRKLCIAWFDGMSRLDSHVYLPSQIFSSFGQVIPKY